jgi:hypothetical protein
VPARLRSHCGSHQPGLHRHLHRHARHLPLSR